MGRFVVNVADLVGRPGARRREVFGAPLGELRVVTSVVPAGSEATVDVVLEWVSDGLLATGAVTAPWRGECRRCLASVEGDARVEFRELFEADPHEGESYRLQRDQIDLEPLVREAVLLELPLAPLCRAACRGLCPHCGTNLNDDTCDCAVEERDPRWAVLDQLRRDEGSVS